ncbi:oligosaccharide flippase family protein [uncultured Psychroserpens sp.]|uniref:oligosaccharide flippase family protein n=1 Tax=uncultured Psychroserpens sp. TaxID=255436 RepID=UPI00260CB34D|nr:oligosaccharide flippase family protein [uncultured Psychroserpens sp.]
MPKQSNDYTSILKSTSLFGAVQVFNIIISIIRSKVIAIWIGPTGMGIIGLLMSTLKVIGEFTRLGLSTTAVREIALTRNKQNDRESALIIATIKKVVWFTGLLGIIATIILSPLLSHLAFDNYNYTIAFIWISLSLLFSQLTAGQLAILQGYRKLNLLAKANLLGNFLALLVSLPLYYFYRLDAIVPVIILSSVVSLLISWFYANKVKFEKLKISNRDAYTKARGMLRLGFMLSLQASISLVAAYVFQLYLSQVGGVDVVGFYLAGFVILNSYVGMVFNAMRTDYFPKLSGIIESRDEINKTVSQQSVIGILLIGPLVVGFLSFLPLIIKLLYSKAFLVIVGFMSWAILGMLFKTLSWSMGYVILAKGDSKLFIKTALFFNTLMLVLNILGYYFYDLEGLGISFLIYYICHFIGLKIITSKRYKLELHTELMGIFIVLLSLSLATFGVTYINDLIYKYVLCALLIIISGVYSYYQLNKRVNFQVILKRFFKTSNE